MKTNYKLVACLLGVALFGLAIWLPVTVLADSGLPDRNPPPAPHDEGKDNNRDSTPLGATIELTAWPPGGVSVVQWQDANGDWQDVDGWRGALDSGGHIRWWVAAKDFGSGPFRWKVGEAVSEPFNLPGGAGQVMQVSIN